PTPSTSSISFSFIRSFPSPPRIPSLFLRPFVCDLSSPPCHRPSAHRERQISPPVGSRRVLPFSISSWSDRRASPVAPGVAAPCGRREVLNDGFVHFKPTGVRLPVQAVADRGLGSGEEQFTAELHVQYLRRSVPDDRCGLQSENGHHWWEEIEACNLGHSWTGKV
ncbi:hypothetical protein Taro_034469, partial [Colocasia esculenta]|nr:hypothetical protein [Colocasia esculenta]